MTLLYCFELVRNVKSEYVCGVNNYFRQTISFFTAKSRTPGYEAKFVFRNLYSCELHNNRILLGNEEAKHFHLELSVIV